MKKLGLYTITLVILLTIGIAAFALYQAVNDDSDEQTADQIPDDTREQNTTNNNEIEVTPEDNENISLNESSELDEQNEQSEPTNLPETSNSSNVVLTFELSTVSFQVADDVTQTNSPTIHRQHPDPSVCTYLGETDSYLIAVYETDSLCIDNFDFFGPISSSIGTLTTTRETKEGSRGDILIHEFGQISNGVSVSFFFKELVENSVFGDFVDFVDSYEVEL